MTGRYRPPALANSKRLAHPFRGSRDTDRFCFTLGTDYVKTVLRRMNLVTYCPRHVDFTSDLTRRPTGTCPEFSTVGMTSMSSYDTARNGTDLDPTTTMLLLLRLTLMCRLALSAVDDENRLTPPAVLSSNVDASGSNDPTAGSSVDKGWELVPLLEGFTTKRRVAQLPCFMVETPVRNKEFWGRESVLNELDTILLPQDNIAASFSPGNATQRHAVLCGIAGIGKTSIAIMSSRGRQISTPCSGFGRTSQRS